MTFILLLDWFSPSHLGEDVTLGNGQTFSSLTGRTSGLPQGQLFTTLYSFNGTDGSEPTELIQAADGNFYGTTSTGGSNNGGTVFKITPSGMLTTLYNFDSMINGDPGGLTQATDGDFYGTTYSGGTNGFWTVFKITPGGFLTTLHSFDWTDGDFVDHRLMQHTNGNLYGITERGGVGGCNAGCGTVYSLSVGLRPFVETQPTSGKVGAVVKILGTNLNGATSISFNGTPATFTVESSSTAIKTTVPSGATTGPVQVVTPSGTLTSNVSFRVLQ